MATRALVTGANRGIGKAVLHRLAAIPDMELLAVARREEDAVAAARELGARALGVALDLADPREVIFCAEETRRSPARGSGVNSMQRSSSGWHGLNRSSQITAPN